MKVRIDEVSPKYLMTLVETQCPPFVSKDFEFGYRDFVKLFSEHAELCEMALVYDGHIDVPVELLIPMVLDILRFEYDSKFGAETRCYWEGVFKASENTEDTFLLAYQVQTNSPAA